MGTPEIPGEGRTNTPLEVEPGDALVVQQLDVIQAGTPIYCGGTVPRRTHEEIYKAGGIEGC